MRNVELREIFNLEQVTDLPAQHYRVLARIAAPNRCYGVHIAAELGDVARHLTPPEVMRIPAIATLWQRVAVKIEELGRFYRGHPEYDGWCEDATRAILAAVTQATAEAC